MPKPQGGRSEATSIDGDERSATMNRVMACYTIAAHPTPPKPARTLIVWA
jgi:hypothetical protein